MEIASMTLVRYIKADRAPYGACYAPGDIVGWPDEIARKLIEQGFALAHDAGHGLGVVAPNASPHGREPWETDREWDSREPAYKAALAEQAKQAKRGAR